MSDISPQLPVDTETLQALLVAARAERDAAIAERDEVLSQNDRLRHLLRQLQRLQFGRRSEKLDPDQLGLALEVSSKPLPARRPTTIKRIRRPRERAPTNGNRGALPAPLPHVDVTIEPDDTNSPAVGGRCM
jgi:transposase